MSWVLILTSSYLARPPAVVGGYPTRDDAEQAGELATAYDEEKNLTPDFCHYTVVPGAACSEPVSSVHVKTSITSEWNDEKDKFTLKVNRSRYIGEYQK